MKIKIKNFVFAGFAAAMFAGVAHAEVSPALQEGDLTSNATTDKYVTAKSYVDRVVLNHKNNTDVHVSAADREAWNAAANAASSATSAIADLDLTEVGGNGNVVMTVSQADGQVSATAGKIANANVADNAAISQSKIDGLTGALAAKAETSFVGTLPAGAQATTVTGYIDEAAQNAGTAAVENLDYVGASGTGVVKQVTQTDGTISATKSPVTNEDIANNAAIAQSKIANLTSSCSENAPCAWVNNVWVPIQQ